MACTQNTVHIHKRVSDCKNCNCRVVALHNACKYAVYRVVLTSNRNKLHHAKSCHGVYRVGCRQSPS